MDQPALDQRLGTVGANPPCCSRTARSRIDHRYSRKRRRQAASTDIPQIKEGSNRQALGRKGERVLAARPKRKPLAGGAKSFLTGPLWERAAHHYHIASNCMGAAGVWARLIRRGSVLSLGSLLGTGRLEFP